MPRFTALTRLHRPALKSKQLLPLQASTMDAPPDAETVEAERPVATGPNVSLVAIAKSSRPCMSSHVIQIPVLPLVAAPFLWDCSLFLTSCNPLLSLATGAGGRGIHFWSR